MSKLIENKVYTKTKSFNCKLILVLLLVLTQLHICNAQLTVDAGPNKYFCIDYWPMDTAIYLGDDVIIKNAIEPLTITWTCELDIGISRIFYASDFLNDTTILNPSIIEISGKWPVKFFLNITDSEGNYSIDSIMVNFSVFVFDLREYHFYIHKGDSLQFDGQDFITGGIPPIEIVWTPSYGLSDSTLLDAWAKPDTNTMYYQVATDSVGCVSQPNLIYVVEILLNTIEDNSNEITIWQNASEIVIDEKQESLKQLKVYSMGGKLIYTTETTKTHINIGNKIKVAGIYICSIAIDNKYYSLKFIKN